jgi:hypothetical protein
VDTGSGARLFYTSNSVENEIGMMQVGHPCIRLVGQPVDSGLTRYKSERKLTHAFLWQACSE